MTNRRKKKGSAGNNPPPPKAKRPLNAGKPTVEPFPLRPSQMVRDGWQAARRAPAAMALGAVLPLAASYPIMKAGQTSVDQDHGTRGVVLLLVGLVVGGALSYPWLTYSLRAVRGEPVDLAEPFRSVWFVIPMLIASFWFWAGILLGLQFFVLPAVVVFVFYVFFGFVLIDRPDLGALKALGTSGRIGQGRRVAMFGLAILYLAGISLAVAAAFSLVGTGPFAELVLYAVLGVCACIAVPSWASLYDVLRKELPDAW